MRKFLTASLVGILMLFSGMALGAQSTAWRLNIQSSVDDETPVVVSEVEFLYDSGGLTDATTSDNGKTVCVDILPSGWECDSVLTNQRGTPSSTLSGVRTSRQVRIVFDNNNATYYQTNEKILSDNPFYIQYTWYQGSSASGRTIQDITAYSIVVPIAYVDTGAPLVWTVEYLDNGNWIVADTVDGNGINWGNGTDVVSGSTTIAKKLTFILD